MAMFCVAMSSVFLVFGIAVSIMYYGRYRSGWATSESEKADAHKLLTDPNTPAEALRNIALQAHSTVHSGFELIDTVIHVLVITTILAGVILFRLFIGLRRVARNANERAL
jgi:hypothetical protein